MMGITRGMIFLTTVLLVHLGEEVLTGFRMKFPIGEMPKTVFVWINLLIYTYSLVTVILSWKAHPLAVPLAWIFALVIVLNGLGHIAIMVVRRTYFPGGVTAFLLLPVAGLLIKNLLSR